MFIIQTTTQYWRKDPQGTDFVHTPRLKCAPGGLLIEGRPFMGQTLHVKAQQESRRTRIAICIFGSYSSPATSRRTGKGSQRCAGASSAAPRG